MKFTKEEIMFFTSVSHGKKPIGITICKPQQEEKEAYIRETLLSLARKGIVGEEGRLTQEGAGVLRFWEMYRNSEKHVAIGDTYLALIPGGKLLMVTPAGDEYEVRFIMPEVLLHDIIKSSEYLRLGEEKADSGKWQKYEEAEWIEKASEVEGSIHLREFTNGIQTDDRLYFWTKEKGYFINIPHSRICELSSGVMRRQMYVVLGGKINERPE